MSLITDQAQKAAASATKLAQLDNNGKNKVLQILQQELKEAESTLLDANKKDVEKASQSGLSPHMIDRLTLSAKGLESLIDQISQVMALADPIGGLEDWQALASGLKVGRMRIPLGLIAFICEARPGAVIEAAALCLKSGNGIIIKAGKEMAETAGALARTFAKGLERAGLEPQAVTILPTLDRKDLQELLSLDGIIDLVIPRGGEGLIRFVSEHSRIPVLKHYRGVCHLYVDESADLKMALELIINSKTNRPSTCNSLETLLVHQNIAAALLPKLAQAAQERQLTIKACPQAKALMAGAETALADDFGREFLDLTLAVKVVADLDEALSHISTYGSKHTEVIVTSDEARSKRFLKEVDAGCVMHNASTRLNDGGSLGLGAEIGISTTKLHAYGPMGLRELSTTKFVVLGQGQVRS